MPQVTDSLSQALDRIEDFKAIHETCPGGVTIEDVNCLQEAVGITDPTRVLIRERIYEGEDAASEPSEMFLGVIVGLLAAQLAAEGAPGESA